VTQPTESKLEIGNRIRGLRKKRGLNLQQLSKESGISVGYLSDIERGESALSGEKIASIARILSTSTDYLLSGRNPTLSPTPLEINIPATLSTLAVTQDLSYEQTIRLLEGRRSLIARRSSGKNQDWTEEHWEEFYNNVKEYL